MIYGFGFTGRGRQLTELEKALHTEFVDVDEDPYCVHRDKLAVFNL